MELYGSLVGTLVPAQYLHEPKGSRDFFFRTIIVQAKKVLEAYRTVAPTRFASPVELVSHNRTEGKLV